MQAKLRNEKSRGGELHVPELEENVMPHNGH